MRGTEGRAPERAGCLPSGVGRPWVLVVAMLVPAVVGGALMVVSLAGVGVQERQAGAARADAGVVGAAPRRQPSFAMPEVVYGRAVVKVSKAGERRGPEAAGSRRAPARSGVESRSEQGERERGPSRLRGERTPALAVMQRGREVERGGKVREGKRERKKAEECPPGERGRVEVGERSAEAGGKRAQRAQVGGKPVEARGKGVQAGDEPAQGGGKVSQVGERTAEAGERVKEQEGAAPLLRLRILATEAE